MTQKDNGCYAPREPLRLDLEDIRCWLLEQIDGGEEVKGHDSMLSTYINTIDAALAALPSETTPIPASKTQAKRYAAQSAPSATAAPSVWTCVYNGLVEKPCKVCDCEMKGYAPQAAPVEVAAITDADRYQWLRKPRGIARVNVHHEKGSYWEAAVYDSLDRYIDAAIENERRDMKGEQP